MRNQVSVRNDRAKFEVACFRAAFPLRRMVLELGWQRILTASKG